MDWIHDEYSFDKLANNDLQLFKTSELQQGMCDKNMEHRRDAAWATRVIYHQTRVLLTRIICPVCTEITSSMPP